MRKIYRLNLAKITAILISAVILLGLQTKIQAAWPGYKVNSKLSIPELNLGDNTYIIDYKEADVNGDKDKDDVLLVGEKEDKPEDPYSANICIIVKDGKTKAYSKLEPGEVTVGFNSRIFLGDFNKDGIDDIFVSIGNDAESKGSVYSLISLASSSPRKLFEQETFSQGLYFNFSYKDNFKVDIYNKDMNKSFLIDLRPYKEYYTDNKIYNEKGKLLKEPRGICNAMSDLAPVDIDKDGVYELKGAQSLLCEKESKVIAKGETVWKFRYNRINLESVKVINSLN